MVRRMLRFAGFVLDLREEKREVVKHLSFRSLENPFEINGCQLFEVQQSQDCSIGGVWFLQR